MHKFGLFALALATLASAPAHAGSKKFNIERFADRLENSTWARRSASPAAVLHYANTFLSPGEGGEFVLAINGQRQRFPFDSYDVIAVDGGHEGLEVDVEFPKSKIQGIIVTHNAKGKALAWILIINNNCLIDITNVGNTLDHCLKRQ